MAMEQSRSGAGNVVNYEEAITGRRRSGSLSTYLDIGRGVDGGRAARPPVSPPQCMGSRRRTYADGELDVFAAERYFKGAMDGDDGGGRRRSDGASEAVVPVETAAARAGPAVGKQPASAMSSAASVSASSVASANSQTALIRGRRGGGDRADKKCCVQVGVLMRSCSGKRSVSVDAGAAAKQVRDGGAGDNNNRPVESRIDWYRELRLQKATIALAAGGGNNIISRGAVVAAGGLPPNSSSAKVASVGRKETREDKAELGGASSRRRSFTLVAPVRTSAPAASGEPHDDDDGAGSESSSDLFELKSIVIGDCPYEPSEASVQWSVATASAADASERGGDRSSARWIAPVMRPHRDRAPPVGLLSGCANHRAVDVSAPVRKAAPPTATARRRSGGLPVARNGA